MAIDTPPISSINPAFLRLAPSILDSARPQIEPVGYAQRYGFIGPTNPLERTNETSPSYLRTFAAGPPQSQDDSLAVGPLGQDELDASIAFTGRDSDVNQLALFEQNTQHDVGDSARVPFLSSKDGIGQYSAIQSRDFQSNAQGSISINV